VLSGRRRARNVADADALQAARQKRSAEVQAQRDAEESERLKAELRRGYFAADPSATEQDFEAALPDLLQRRRAEGTLHETQRSRQTIASRMGGRLI
jgi:t-SNARE complex subunit (syntaxin)